MSYKHEVLQRQQIEWFKSEKGMTEQQIAILDWFNSLTAGLDALRNFDTELLNVAESHLSSRDLQTPKQLLKTKLSAGCDQIMNQYGLTKISFSFPDKYKGDDLRLEVEKTAHGFMFRTGEKVSSDVQINFGKYGIQVGGVEVFCKTLRTVLAE